jgi:hypothetical protein
MESSLQVIGRTKVHMHLLFRSCVLHVLVHLIIGIILDKECKITGYSFVISFIFMVLFLPYIPILISMPVKYQKASCVFNLQALPANPNSQPPRGGPGTMHNGLCSR